MGHAVLDFFNNGGGRAEIVRLYRAGAGMDGVATIDVDGLRLRARDPGSWGNELTATVTHSGRADPAGAAAAAAAHGLLADDLFDLQIGLAGLGASEIFRNLTVRADGGARRFDRVLAGTSALVEAVFVDDGAARPADGATAGGVGGDDGEPLDASDFIGDEAAQTGIHALSKADMFNLLCIPPDALGGTLDRSVNAAAAAFCRARRALLIVDPPAEWDADPAMAAATARAAQLDASTSVLPMADAAYTALYFPRLLKRDPLRGGQVDVFPPCGAVAGVMARSDGQFGVWKAPAGVSASLADVDGLTVDLTDAENGLLNGAAINCLRRFPQIGTVIWGARTLKGLDQLQDDYRYVPVRRLGLFVEESLFRGTRWVVFEPNDEPLWAQIRLSVAAFLHGLYLQGAFQGQTPREAYFVKCDSETVTEDDRARGIVNIIVGFAPLQPAEFVIISIQQIAGEG